MHPQPTGRALEWGSLISAILVTAVTEYRLALLAGIPTEVAWALPLAIDLYVVQALRVGRDIAGAVGGMCLINAAAHGVDAYLTSASLVMTWVSIGVSVIAPVVLWRVHVVGKPVPPVPLEPHKRPMEPEQATAAPVEPLADVVQLITPKPAPGPRAYKPSADATRVFHDTAEQLGRTPAIRELRDALQKAGLPASQGTASRINAALTPTREGVAA